ncbi:Zn2 DNA-binding protein-3 [Coleophoma cylindrospora]|uniref:Zn2 DNA-binding protein-3 n=1 Tax=Coleophoma cylindrospora TaxID=1849047 RepID=A0A3D8RAZ8_9HELO|nr:Zn2 DNA-binding protein-3 [Coleophoma cylindrospora]
MPVTQAANDFPMRSTSDFEAAPADARSLTPMQHDPFDLDQIMMNHQNSHSAPLSSRSPPQPDATDNAQFADFAFPYNGMETAPADQKVENQTDPYNLANRPDHRRSVASAHSIHRGSFSSGVPGQAGNASMSGGSEEASPSSIRAGTGDGGFGDEFGLGSGSAVDGSDLGSRTREEKNDPAPAWSELKTKAGKERKRLPLACIACRRKKIRCSGEKPACKHCLRSRIPCVYKVTTRKAAPRTDYMAMLDKRLKRMEERIIKIVPKEEQDPAAVNITRATVKPSIPGGAPLSKESKAKKRAAEEAFGPELENWSKSASASKLDTSEKPSSLQIQEAEESKLLLEGADKLPAKDIQEHLSEVFFENVYGQTYHVLHKPSFMRKLRGGTLPPVLILAVCAVSARFSSHPKVNSTPAFLRGEEWASEARDIVMRRYEWPNITILTCLLILGLHEFGTCQGGRSWALGGQAIRMAYALQLHRDLDYDPLKRNGTAELSFIDREIRRRTMWACFLMDRFNSSGTDRPTFIKEEGIKIQLPIKEKYFHLDMPGPTENLKGEVLHPASPGTGQLSNARDNMGVAAYMVKAITLWGRIINYLNLGGNEEDPHPMWHPESRYAELIKQSEVFDAELPEDLKYCEENLHTHETEGLANQYLFLHISIQQNILFMNRFAVPRHPGGRPPKDVPKEFVTKAGAKAFEAANRISDLLKDGEPYFVTAPFTGYCAFLSSTVHIFGVFSKNAAMEAASKKNLATNVKYLSRMKRYWGMFHWMSENLKEQYRLCADATRRGPSALGPSQPSSTIFQYGDWFDRYPHGVSQSDFEDPVAGVKKEKGDDAVLEQKMDYHTVEDFFQSLGEMQTGDPKPSKPNKRKAKNVAPTVQDHIDPIQSNIPDMAPQLQMQNSGPQIQAAYTQMSPTSTVNMYSHNQQAPYYSNHDMLLPPHQQGILPQLDRQLVFGAYAGMDPSSLSSQNMLDSTAAWDMQMGGMHGFVNEPSSAWFMPFNIEPPVPEAAPEVDVFNAMGGTNVGYGMAGMPVNNNGMGGHGGGH